MSGLVLKDLLVLRKQGKSYLMIIGVYTLLTLVGAFDYSMLTAMMTIIIMMMPMSSFSYDDLARWDKYAVSTPVGRSGIVKAKYALVLVISIAAAALCLLVVALVTSIRADGESWSELLLILVSCLGVGLLMNAITLPLMFKYGAEKSRGIYMGVMVLFFVFIFGIGTLVSKGFLTLSQIVTTLAPWLLVALVVGGFIASYFMSQRIYLKKEL